MIKPTTGTVCFDDEEQGSGVFIKKEDAAVYAKAITEVLRVLERNPAAVNDLEALDLRALKNLAHVVKGDGLATRLDLRRFVECLKQKR